MSLPQCEDEQTKPRRDKFGELIDEQPSLWQRLVTITDDQIDWVQIKSSEFRSR